MNYLIVKRLPNFENLEVWEKFRAIVHSGITRRIENPKDRMFENKKGYNDLEYGMVLLFIWHNDDANFFGFYSPGSFEFFY
jgi:hypothetical protein